MGTRLDGDVWGASANLIRLKGVQSIRVGWTEGHATEDDARRGKSTVTDKRGNDAADALTSSGHCLKGPH